MNDAAQPLLGFGFSQLLDQRLALVRGLAESLECSNLALTQKDAEAIVRGATHQAELCRQWSCLETQLRQEQQQKKQAKQKVENKNVRASERPLAAPPNHPTAADSARLQAEWDTLSARIRYLTRVHHSLLCHLERSLAVLSRVIDTCAHTYTPSPALFRTELRLRSAGCDDTRADTCARPFARNSPAENARVGEE